MRSYLLMNELKAFLWRNPDLSNKVRMGCLSECIRKEMMQMMRGYVFDDPGVVEHFRHRTTEALNSLVSQRELRNFKVRTSRNRLEVEITIIAPVQDIKATFSITP